MFQRMVNILSILLCENETPLRLEKIFPFCNIFTLLKHAGMLLVATYANTFHNNNKNWFESKKVLLSPFFLNDCLPNKNRLNLEISMNN